MMKAEKEMQTFKVLFSIKNAYKTQATQKTFPHTHTHFNSKVII